MSSFQEYQLRAQLILQPIRIFRHHPSRRLANFR